MNHTGKWVSSLSIEKRRLLETRLLKKGASAQGEESLGQRRAAEDTNPLPIIHPPFTPMNQTHEQIENQMDLLSFGQESLWFLDQFESASALYLIPIALRLRGELNVEALCKAFETILQRHE